MKDNYQSESRQWSDLFSTSVITGLREHNELQSRIAVLQDELATANREAIQLLQLRASDQQIMRVRSRVISLSTMIRNLKAEAEKSLMELVNVEGL